jgi:hypothetical protein
MMVRPQVLLSDDDFSLDMLPQWERTFAVEFDPQAFAQVVTVGDMVAVVEQQISRQRKLSSSARCASQRTYYRLRQVVEKVTLGEQSMTPHSRLADFLPLRNRRRQWQQLEKQSGMSFPALSIPFTWFLVVWAVGAAAVGGLVAPWGWAVLSGFGVALFVSSCSLVQVALPAATLGALTTQLVATHYHQLSQGQLTRREVRAIVLAGLASCSSEWKAVLPTELGDETRLVW